MPFTMPSYPMFTPEQINPYANALQKLLSGYTGTVQAAYAKPNAEQELQKAIIANKLSQQQYQWNPKIWQSEIGLRGAQSGLAGAQAGLAGAETEKTRFLTQHPQYINSDAFLISKALENANQTQSNVQQIQPSPGYQLSSTDKQGISNLQPGQSYILGAGGTAPNINIENAHQAAETPTTLQQTVAPKGEQLSQPTQATQYDTNALSYNPPQLPSPTGNSALDSYYYKRFGISPVYQSQLELAQQQAGKYQDVFNNKLGDLNNQSVFAGQSTADANKFLDALDRVNTLQTGFYLGRSPALTDARQEMDSAGANMVSSAAKLFQEGRAVHAADIELQNMAKPSSRQNSDVAFDLAQGIIAKNDRLKETQQFYALGRQLGLKPEILDSMFSKYQTDRPYIDPQTKMPNDAYKGTWKDYLSPQAINSFLAGRDYVPPSQSMLNGMNWTKRDLTDVKDWAKKNHLNPKDFEKKNLYKLARNEHIPLSQLKMELMKRGAFKNAD